MSLETPTRRYRSSEVPRVTGRAWLIVDLRALRERRPWGLSKIRPYVPFAWSASRLGFQSSSWMVAYPEVGAVVALPGPASSSYSGKIWPREPCLTP